MRNIRILVVVGSLRVGGQERVATSIVEYIDKEKFQVDYLVYDDIESSNTQTVINNGGKLIRDKNIFADRTKIVKRLTKIIIDNGPYDIVHSHGMFNNGYVMLASKKAGIKCRIAHSHSTNAGKNTNSLVYKFYMMLMRFYMLKYATSIVACGTQAGEFLFGKSAFKKYGGIFYNRIDSDVFEYSETRKLNLRQKLNITKHKIFIIVGHIIPLKNHRFAFQVFEKYHSINQDSELLILGDGELRQELEEEVASRNLNDSIIFLGNVNNVNEYMIVSDCLLMPSWYEGLPVTLVEAQSAGLHCIVSDTVTKEVDITGLISWRSLDDLSGWVKDMQSEYKRKSMKEKIVEKNYDFCNYTEWLTNFYFDLLR